MSEYADIVNYELAVVIVNYGSGSKVLKAARQCGVPGGTVFLGMGTARNRILQFLELTDIRKEIVIMGAEKSCLTNALKIIDREFDFKKPYHGIAFTLPLAVLLGTGNKNYAYHKGGGKNNMYDSIFTIVDKGKAELVMDAAKDAGARGGTVIKARGSGIEETGKLFHMNIEPEKEIVLILSLNSDTEKIVGSIKDKLGIGQPGSGIVFCLAVSDTYGM